MIQSMSNFINHVWIDSVEQAGENSPPGFPDNPEDCRRNDKTDDRVCQWVAQPYPRRTEKNGETGQAVHAGVIAIRDEGGTADLFPYLDAKDCHSFVAKETNHRCNNHGP